MSTAAEIQIKMAAAEMQCSGIIEALGAEVKRMTSTGLLRPWKIDHLSKTQRRYKGNRARRQAFYNAQRFKRTLNRFYKATWHPENEVEYSKALNDARRHGEGWVQVLPGGRAQHIRPVVAQ